MNTEKELNVLSLFDGMSCGRIALERAVVPVANYYASEIDKHAIKVSEANYPDIIRLGDVTKIKIDKGRQIDLLIAGSPCQGFSFAGKLLNFSDPRSALFFEFVRILKECRIYNPDVKFLLENVKMKKEYQDIISEYLGVKPVFIDSSNFSAHNRPRLYWTNISNLSEMKRVKTGKLISDIISQDVTDSLYLNEDQIKRGFIKNAAQKFSSGSSCGRVSFPTPLDRKVKSLTVLRIKGSREETHIRDERGVRILSRNEREKAQCVPVNYTACVSENNAFDMLGNGWTVDVIAHIFKGLKK